jgi:hypothetical protein
VQLHRENGHVIASFRYDGSTCRFTGHPLTAVLSMKLVPADGDDFVIEDTRSCEGEGDTGCSRMCSYVASPETFMSDIDAENPLRGMSLSQAILWNPQMEMAGCLCSRESRNHKWRNAVQAIHLALNAKN